MFKNMMFKKLAYLIIAAPFALAGCAGTDAGSDPSRDTPSTPPEQTTPEGPQGGSFTITRDSPEEYWGEWICGANGAVWYIAARGITIEGDAPDGGVELLKESERVIAVREGAQTYKLYASRVTNAAFTGRLAKAGSGAAASFAGGRAFALAAGGETGFIPAAGVTVTVSSLKNPSLTRIVTSGDDGQFIAAGIIPGDAYTVTPEGGTAETVTIADNGQDIGTIALTRGVNFKTRVVPWRNTYGEHLFEGHDYDVTVEIENVGTEECGIATYRIEASEYLRINSHKNPDGADLYIFGTIEPGMKKRLELNISCDNIPGAESLEKVYIAISDPSAKKTWVDAASFVFKKGVFDFNIRAQKAINGVLMPPNAQARYFNNTAETFTMPASDAPFLAYFCGATATNETKYSFGIGRPAPDPAALSPQDVLNYEPNNTEAQATPVTAGMANAAVSFLHKNDVDFYTFTPNNAGIYQPEDKTVTYTVTYYANGADGTAPAAKTVNGNAVITLAGAAGLTHGGKYFSGWNTAAGGGGTRYAAGATVRINANLGLYAQWTAAPEYTITYYANNAGGTPPAAQTVTGGTAINVAGADGLVQTGKTFAGWNTNADGSGTAYAAGAQITMNANVNLYAQWTPLYTITYYPNGAGGTAPAAQTVNGGAAITLAGAGSLTLAGKIFSGWNTNVGGSGTAYAAGAQVTVSANMGLYAQWSENVITVPGATPTAKLAWLESNAASNGAYRVELDRDEIIGPRTLSYSGKSGIRLTMTGGSVERTVDLSSNGSLFTVGSGVTLILDNNLTLRGRSGNTASLVTVNTGGALEMRGNTKITGNTTTSQGGGVYMGSNTSFTMSGSASVSGNATSHKNGGGGVYIGSNASFTMSGTASVSDNSTTATHTVSGSASNYAYSNSSGVYIDSGAGFTMSESASVSRNSTGVTSTVTLTLTSSTSVNINNGGVYIGSNASFAMNGSASVSGNTTNTTTTGSATTSNNSYLSIYSNGSGVYVGSGSSFSMSDSASISGNSATNTNSITHSTGSSRYIYASNRGGGVYFEGKTFVMRNNAVVSGNTITGTGGGVYVVDGKTFVMRDNVTVSGNTITGTGGGVAVGTGTFTIGGGTIYGNDAETGLKNTGGTYAALYGSAQYGEYIGDTLYYNNTLSSTDSTIKIVNGVKR